MAKLNKEDRELLKAIKEAYLIVDVMTITRLEEITGIDPMLDDDNFDGTPKNTAHFMVREVKRLVGDEDECIGMLKRVVLNAIPKELEEVVEKVGSTPLEEPEIYEAFKKKDDSILADAISKKYDLDLDKYPIDINISFLNKVADKVVGLLNDEGKVKHTELTKKMGFVDKNEAKKLKDLIIDATSEEKEEELDKKVIKILSKKRKEIFKEASEWEKELMAQEAIIQVTQPSKSMTAGF